MRLDTQDILQIATHSAIGAIFGTIYNLLNTYSARRSPARLPIQVEALYNDPQLVIQVNLLQEVIADVDNVAFFRMIDTLDVLLFTYYKLSSRTDEERVCTQRDVEFAVLQFQKTQRALRRLRSSLSNHKATRASHLIRFKGLTQKIIERAQDYLRLIIAFKVQN